MGNAEHMGTAALNLQWAVFNKINMYKLAIFCVAMTGALAAPEAEPGYLAPALYNAYPNWPGYSTPYSSSTCFGCRGKRSADADAYYGYGYAPFYRGIYAGVAGHPTGTSYVARSAQGIGKRSADADAYYGYPSFYRGLYTGVAAPPTGTSFVARSPEGLRGKRSADADADAYYGYPYAYGYGYPYAYGYRSYGYPYGYARW